jgi:hypothetical protein
MWPLHDWMHHEKAERKDPSNFDPSGTKHMPALRISTLGMGATARLAFL